MIFALVTWLDFLQSFLKNPGQFIQGHWPYLLGLLLVLFGLSRLNNYMEVQGVNRAINIARAFTGSLMAFVIAPIVFLMLVNLVAYVKGIPMFSFWFIWDWLRLTATTFWWIVKCATCFSCESEKMEVAYTTSSLIRIAWVIIPISFIWLRSVNSNLSKILLIPFVLAVFYITYQRPAPPTFLDKHVPEKYRNFEVKDFLDLKKHERDTKIPDKDIVINNDQRKPGTDTDRTRSVKPETDKTTPKPEIESERDIIKDYTDKGNRFKNANARNIVLLLIALLLVAGLLHFLTDFKWAALACLLLCLVGFFIMMPGLRQSFNPTDKIETLDDMVEKFEDMHTRQNGKPSVSLTSLSVKINKRIEKTGRHLPEDFCKKYKPYFYDICVERAEVFE